MYVCVVFILTQNQSLGEMIANNFLQLNFVFREVYPQVMVDKPTMSVAILLSNVGGLSSLWLGITAMTVCEFVELGYRIVTALWAASRRNRPAVDVTDGNSAAEKSCGLPPAEG